MSMRSDHRAQLRDLLQQTLTAHDGTVPAAVRRSACQVFGLSDRQLFREIAAVRASPSQPGQQPAQTAPAGRRGWWSDTRHTDHVLSLLAATDTMKQAWAKLCADGTIAVSYPQFTRQLDRYLKPAVKAGLTGNGREAYLEASVYLVDQVPHRNIRWQADAQEVPVWVRGDHGETPFKPYQVTFIDEATRMIMGTVIVAGRPTAADVVAALASAVRGITAPDGTFIGGLPTEVRWDNGGEFLNEAVTEASARLGIVPRPAPPYSPHRKGKIERWHATSQNELYSELPGASDGPLTYTGLQPWRGEPDRLLTLSALTLQALEWVRTYNYDRVHSALGATPLEAWKTDTHPLRTATAAQLHPLMLTLPQTRTVGKDGITYKGVKFQAPELGAYRRRKVTVRVLPNDLDTIAVFDGDAFVCDAVRAEQLSPQRRRELVAQRHADYQKLKTALNQASRRRAQEAVILGLTDPGAAPAPDLPAGELVADDAALLALLQADLPPLEPGDAE